MIRAGLPLLILIALAVLLWVGLGLDPDRVPSPLIGKPAPAFELPDLEREGETVTEADISAEGAALFNVWASWCPPCLDEHPLFMELVAREEVPIIGLNYRDQPEAAREWLARHGNPYRRVALDREGRTGIDWGVYGVPETYVVDAEGVIRYKHVGPIDERILENEIMPLVRELRAGESP